MAVEELGTVALEAEGLGQAFQPVLLSRVSQVMRDAQGHT